MPHVSNSYPCFHSLPGFSVVPLSILGDNYAYALVDHKSNEVCVFLCFSCLLGDMGLAVFQTYWPRHTHYVPNTLRLLTPHTFPSFPNFEFPLLGVLGAVCSR